MSTGSGSLSSSTDDQLLQTWYPCAATTQFLQHLPPRADGTSLLTKRLNVPSAESRAHHGLRRNPEATATRQRRQAIMEATVCEAFRREVVERRSVLPHEGSDWDHLPPPLLIEVVVPTQGGSCCEISMLHGLGCLRDLRQAFASHSRSDPSVAGSALALLCCQVFAQLRVLHEGLRIDDCGATTEPCSSGAISFLRVAHCDVTPANIVICPNGNAHVIDFGNARWLRGNDADDQHAPGVLAFTPGGFTPGFADPRLVEGDGVVTEVDGVPVAPDTKVDLHGVLESVRWVTAHDPSLFMHLTDPLQAMSHNSGDNGPCVSMLQGGICHPARVLQSFWLSVCRQAQSSAEGVCESLL